MFPSYCTIEGSPKEDSFVSSLHGLTINFHIMLVKDLLAGNEDDSTFSVPMIVEK